MSKREYILRYLLIIRKLRNRRQATFKEINDFLILESELQSYKLSISKRTFQRDLNEIRSLFNVDIQYNFSDKVYYIAVDEQQDINNRMLEAFDMLNSLNIAEDLSPYIYLEKRRPLGTEHLYGLIHAIKNRFLIRFTYQKFWEDEVTHRTAEPYALKEFKGRWYVLANDRKDNTIKTFGLDRISQLEISRELFKYPENFNINEYFKYCFGIITSPDTEPEEIVLSFEPVQGKYIKSFPLHETQKVIVDNKEELQIKLKLHITHDFIMELLSFGDTVKILKQESMKSEIKAIYQNALNQY